MRSTISLIISKPPVQLDWTCGETVVAHRGLARGDEQISLLRMEASETTAADTYSALATFLKSLAETGHAPVMPEPLTTQADDAVAALQQVDVAARAELALDCPAFSPETALWAARLVYHLCQFTICRDIDEKRIQEICSVPCPEPRSPDVDWSADLTLRHLPRIFHLARQLSNADPLVQHMRTIAIAWPLSSVGFPRLEGFQIEPFINHPTLRRLYADRIMAIGDDSRLGDARLDDTLRADLSIHRELSPAIARKIFQDTHDTH